MHSTHGLQDYIPELVGLSKANLEKDDESMLTSGRVLLKVMMVVRPLRGWKEPNSTWAESQKKGPAAVGLHLPVATVLCQRRRKLCRHISWGCAQTLRYARN